jgi:hypothetical protein
MPPPCRWSTPLSPDPLLYIVVRMRWRLGVVQSTTWSLVRHYSCHSILQHHRINLNSSSFTTHSTDNHHNNSHHLLTLMVNHTMHTLLSMQPSKYPAHSKQRRQAHSLIFSAAGPVNFVIDDNVLADPDLVTEIVGDPMSLGLRGQSYQVHGIDGAVYNLIFAEDLQVNSRFEFLTDGTCPVISGVPLHNCWSHAGSYLGAIGIQQVVDGLYHRHHLW